MKRGKIKRWYFGLEVGQNILYDDAGILMEGFQMRVYEEGNTRVPVVTVFDKEMFMECVDV